MFFPNKSRFYQYKIKCSTVNPEFLVVGKIIKSMEY